MCSLGTFLVGLSIGVVGTAGLFYALIKLGEKGRVIGKCPKCQSNYFAVTADTFKIFCRVCGWSED